MQRSPQRSPRQPATTEMPSAGPGHPGGSTAVPTETGVSQALLGMSSGQQKPHGGASSVVPGPEHTAVTSSPGPQDS